MALTARTAALVTTVVLLGSALPARGAEPAAPTGTAQRAYDAGRYEEARRLWSGPAEAGDADAAFGLALLYDLGQGVGHDAQAAYRWYRKAADAGSAEAAFNVAVMHDSGNGAPRDARQAALWYAIAALRGNRRAEYNLGQLYGVGDGVPRNPDVADAWYRAAAGNGIAAASRPARTAGPAPAVAERPHPTYPGAGDVLDLRRITPLVWMPNGPSGPAGFFVEVVGLDSGSWREVMSASTDLSAAPLGAGLTPGPYAWRVSALGRGHYAASDWVRFELR